MGNCARDTIERHATLHGVLDRMVALYRGQEKLAATATFDNRSAMRVAGIAGGENRP
jgi:hypothetical protein